MLVKLQTLTLLQKVLDTRTILTDTVKYYGMYKDLMRFWYQSYDDHIYNLDYDKLTEDQEPETRRLIEYLGLNWEDTCLAPQE